MLLEKLYIIISSICLRVINLIHGHKHLTTTTMKRSDLYRAVARDIAAKAKNDRLIDDDEENL